MSRSRSELGKQLLVVKHLGGPDGKKDHPSGTSQDIHNKGGKSGGAKPPTKVQKPKASWLEETFYGGEWDDADTMTKVAGTLTLTYGALATGLILGGATSLGAKHVGNALDLTKVRMLPSKTIAPPSRAAVTKMDDWEKFSFKFEDLAFHNKLHSAVPEAWSTLMKSKGYKSINHPSVTWSDSYHGSVVTNKGILDMQRAADDVFDLKATTKHFADVTNRKFGVGAHGMSQSTFKGVPWKDAVKDQYNLTQTTLKTMDITHVDLARGMKVGSDQARAMGLKPILSKKDIKPGIWQEADVPLQPLNSFTSDPRVAIQFATGVTPAGGRSSLALLQRRRVPREEVFSNWATGPGARDWDEWVVMGGTQKWDVIAVHPKLLKDHNTAKQLWDMGFQGVAKNLTHALLQVYAQKSLRHG